MKNKFLSMLTIIVAYGFFSCNEFVEEDLKSDWVYAVSPLDFSTIPTQSPILSWEKVKGAESYNLKVYRMAKQYSATLELIVDTNVRSTQFTQALKSGYYKWDIYAQNSSSRSGLSTFRFQIDSISDITFQRVNLVTPDDKHITDTLKQKFEWEAIAAATNYNIQIFEPNNPTAIVSHLTGKNTTTFTFEFPKATKTYTWWVVALNGTLSSQYNKRTLTIDTSYITIPVVVAPKNDTSGIHKNPVTLSWKSVSNASRYNLEIAKDTLGVADTTATLDAQILSLDYYHSDLSKIYYWRIKAVKGKNNSAYTKWWSFRRNP
ncbi:MAG TPA: hypothetical protein VFF27_16245 [Bacteroidia bacterium]|jgi:hypothetical protein|nr:hypothetical protein [Bacteroidia bacterium]